jgi:hypothetical protein
MRFILFLFTKKGIRRKRSAQQDNLSSYEANQIVKRKRSAQQANYNSPPPTYEATTRPPKVHNVGKVIVMPPPGEFPTGYPLPGQPGGGARPETNPYIAAMAPEGTVPIAIYPPFQTKQDYPKKCVIFSELTDFEDQEINDYGNEQQVTNILISFFFVLYFVWFIFINCD